VLPLERWRPSHADSRFKALFLGSEYANDVKSLEGWGSVTYWRRPRSSIASASSWSRRCEGAGLLLHASRDQRAIHSTTRWRRRSPSTFGSSATGPALSPSCRPDGSRLLRLSRARGWRSAARWSSHRPVRSGCAASGPGPSPLRRAPCPARRSDAPRAGPGPAPAPRPGRRIRPLLGPKRKEALNGLPLACSREC
jgi:hypothetical protein